jgi:hypothetical protein
MLGDIKMEDEDFDELYEDILNNGLVNEDYQRKFSKLVDALKDRIKEFSDYSEIDTTEWGTCIY